MKFKPGCHLTSRPANTWEHTLINSEFDDKLINQREMGKFNQKRDEKPALTSLWHITPAMLHCPKNVQPDKMFTCNVQRENRGTLHSLSPDRMSHNGPRRCSASRPPPNHLSRCMQPVYEKR